MSSTQSCTLNIHAEESFVNKVPGWLNVPHWLSDGSGRDEKGWDQASALTTTLISVSQGESVGRSQGHALRDTIPHHPCHPAIWGVLNPGRPVTVEYQWPVGPNWSVGMLTDCASEQPKSRSCVTFHQCSQTRSYCLEQTWYSIVDYCLEARGFKI